MRTLVKLFGGVFVAALLAAGFVLGWAHVRIRQLEPALPSATEVLALGGTELPVRLSWVNTSRQVTPRSGVLDPGRDPRPDAPYVMSHPSFVLEWADGRRLLIDTGMDEEAARAFGRPLEWAGAEPAEPLGSTAAQLGLGVTGVESLIVTHLHTDHIQGAAAICRARPGSRPIALFQTPAQARLRNHTTRGSDDELASAPCLEPHVLEAAPLAPVPGHPGVGVIHVAGHTPGSQVVVAALDRGPERLHVAFTGDVVNAVDGIRHDVPKPLFYRLLIVPEFDAQLAKARRFLRDLEREAGVPLLVAHDLLHLESLGLESLGSGPSRPLAAAQAPQAQWGPGR